MMPPARAEILAIGSEMTDGPRVDTNSVWLRRQLGSIHLRVARVTAVSDEAADLEAALSEALVRSAVIIATGGLGPTEDDRTVAAVSRVTGRPGVVNEQVRQVLEEHLRRAGRRMSASAMRMTQVPRGAQVFMNPVGTAPGLLIEYGGASLWVLPGVPAEMKALFKEAVEPALRRRFGPAAEARAVLRIGGRAESELDDLAAPICREEVVAWTILAAPGMVEFHLRGEAHAVAGAVRRLEAALGQDLISTNGDTLAETVVAVAAARGGGLAVAESCSGGQIAAQLTAVSGVSRVLQRCYVTYSDEAKCADLGVDPDLLRAHGAVSREVAAAMAHGLCRRTGCRWALAVTGIAGPTGGSAAKPVGTVWLATYGPTGAKQVERLFSGDREQIQQSAATVGMDLLRRAMITPVAA